MLICVTSDLCLLSVCWLFGFFMIVFGCLLFVIKCCFRALLMVVFSFVRFVYTANSVFN